MLKTSLYVYVFLLMITMSAILLAAGLTSQVCLGDEVHHYRFAKSSFVQKARAEYDPIFTEPSSLVTIKYVTDPAWPMILTWIWGIYGSISFSIAQIYQTFFYFFLLWGTFLVAKNFYSVETAIWSICLVGTVPMLASFGILFYTDLPATALMVWSFLFLMHRRFLLTGVLMGSDYLMKKNMIFFAPAVFIYSLFSSEEKFRKTFIDLLAYLLPILFIFARETHWQLIHFPENHSILYDAFDRLNQIYHNPKFSTGSMSKRLSSIFIHGEYSNSSILNFLDILKYFGIAIFPGLFLYFIGARDSKKDGLLWIALMSYFSLMLFFRLLPDIRYFMPMVPFLAILSAKGITSCRLKRWRYGVLAVLCVAQLISATLYTQQTRKISPDVAEGFNWIRENTPENALILYPELNIIEYANRPMIWSFFQSGNFSFWGSENKKIEQIKAVGLKYIAVKKSRVYNDALEKRHSGAYPESFVKYLQHWSVVRRVFENNGMSIWEIDNSLLKTSSGSFGEAG